MTVAVGGLMSGRAVLIFNNTGIAAELVHDGRQDEHAQDHQRQQELGRVERCCVF